MMSTGKALSFPIGAFSKRNSFRYNCGEKHTRTEGTQLIYFDFVATFAVEDPVLSIGSVAVPSMAVVVMAILVVVCEEVKVVSVVLG